MMVQTEGRCGKVGSWGSHELIERGKIRIEIRRFHTEIKKFMLP